MMVQRSFRSTERWSRIIKAFLAVIVGGVHHYVNAC